jgi:hypothetical protein
MATAPKPYLEDLPLELKHYLAAKEMRTHHGLWHYVRVAWPAITPARQVELEKAGFRPPRLRGDFLSGLDFVAMHRNMFKDVHKKFPKASIPAGWNPIPFDHNDAEWPMPPTYDQIPEPDWKKSDITKQFEQESHHFPPLKPKGDEISSLAETKYRNMSLDYLGRRIEKGIHDWMHIHWSAEPWYIHHEGQDINDIRNDWLASPYASHVNVRFWKIHGWINDRVNDWACANGVHHVDALLQDAFTGPDMSGDQMSGMKMTHMIEMTPEELRDCESVFVLSRNSVPG